MLKLRRSIRAGQSVASLALLACVCGAWLAACGGSPNPAGGATNPPCDAHSGTGNIAVATSAVPKLSLTGSAWCGEGPVELIAVRVPSAASPVGPSIASGEYVVLWSTGMQSFDEQIPLDASVTLRDGETADLTAGAWVIGFRQDGTGTFMPMPPLGQ